MSDTAGAFKATYAELYDRHLAPLLFAPYARLLSERARTHGRAISGDGGRHRPHSGIDANPAVPITATDLNQP